MVAHAHFSNSAIYIVTTDPMAFKYRRRDTGRMLLYALVVFVATAGYFHKTSAWLPMGAGPDASAHNNVSAFIYYNGRLPVYPKDEIALEYTHYGGTRAFRPPLSYLVSAATARLLGETPKEQLPWRLRKGSVLLGALAVTATFFALSLYFSSYGIGLLGALLIALMPQFSFIASYNNDDTSAILSATLVFTAFIRILRLGINIRNVLLLGLACGLVVLSKQTAWLLAPSVLLFALLFIRESGKKIVRYTAVFLAAAILTGGWWLGFNAYHYGIDDPLLFKITKTVAEKYSQFSDTHVFGYQAQGVSYSDLLLRNHDDFWEKTAKSTIGNIDLLRLRFGSFQYWLYGFVFFTGIFGFLTQAAVGLRLRWDQDRRFESVLVFAILFQFFMFVWANMHNDVQVQGKYLIPVFLPVLLLFFSALRGFARQFVKRFLTDSGTLIIARPRLFQILLGAAVSLVIAAHADAVINYAIPFYDPPAYRLKLRNFEPMELPPVAEIKTSSGTTVSPLPHGGLAVAATTNDPWLLIYLRDPALCARHPRNIIVRFRIDADRPGLFQIYPDLGAGYREKDSFAKEYAAGEQDLLFAIGMPNCHALRIDTARGPGRVTIREIALAVLGVQPRED